MAKPMYKFTGRGDLLISTALVSGVTMNTGNGEDVLRFEGGVLNCNLDGGRGLLDEVWAWISNTTTYTNFEFVTIVDGGFNTILGDVEMNRVELIFTTGDFVSVGAGNDTVLLGNCSNVQVVLGDGNDTLEAIGSAGLVIDAGSGNDSVTLLGAYDNNEVYLGAGTNVLYVAGDAIGGVHHLLTVNLSEGANAVHLSTEFGEGVLDETIWQLILVGAGADDTLHIDGVEYVMGEFISYTNESMTYEVFFA